MRRELEDDNLALWIQGGGGAPYRRAGEGDKRVAVLLEGGRLLSGRDVNV